MSLDELEYKTLIRNGQKFEIQKLETPIDFSEQNENVETQATHILKGFEEDLYLIIETEKDNDGGFYWGHKIGETGLVVNLEDEAISQKATDLLFEALNIVA